MLKTSVSILLLHSIFLSLYAQSSTHPVDSLQMMLVKANALKDKNNMYRALAIASKAATYAHESEDTITLANAYAIMGSIHYEIIDYANAERDLKKALTYASSNDNKLALPKALNTLGNLYYHQKQQPNKALSYYKDALTSITITSSKQYETALLNTIRTHLDLNKVNDAHNYLKEADHIFMKATNCTNLGHYYLLKARQLTSLHKFSAAKKYFEQSEVILKKQPYWPKGTSYLHQYKAEMYELTGKYDLALIERKKLQTSEKKVFEHTRSKSREITKIRFRIDEYEQKLAANLREKELLLNIAKHNKIILYVSLSGLLLLFGTVFFYHKEYNIKTRMNKILSTKNRELDTAKHQAEELSTIKSQFISTISHELRTPLYGVVGISSLLLENNTSTNDTSLLNSLKHSADYLLNLVNKVLNISKIDHKRNDFTQTPINLFTLINNVIASFKEITTKKQLPITLTYDHTIPRLIEVDAISTTEVVTNLIDNAIKFTEIGTIDIRIQLMRKTDHQLCIRFEVTDSGIGIPEDQQEFIFEEFTQVGSVFDNKEGTGLGLTIVKNLLQNMGSTIQFKSKKDKGSTFFFDLHVTTPNHTNSKPIGNDPLHKLNNTIDQMNANVLVAEDHKINQMITRKLLEAIGCSVTITENGLDTIEALQNSTYDIVLMDINMPVLNGMEATKKIRVFDSKTPIIALTASELDEVAPKCLDAGMNGLINKPLQKEDLQKCILKHIN